MRLVFSFDGAVTVGLATLAAVAAAAWAARRRAPLVTIGLGLAVVTSAVEGLVPLPDLFFEHRMYLPMTGVAIALAGAAGAWLGHRAILIGGAAVLLVLAVGTAHRNEVWRSGVTLWQDVVFQAPERPRGYINLSKALMMETTAYAAAERILAEAARLEPDRAETWTDLSRLRSYLGRSDEAVDAARRAVDLAPTEPKAHIRLTRALLDAERFSDAVAAAETALTRHPGDATLLSYLAQARAGAGSLDEAQAASEAALSVAPQMPGALHASSIVLLARGELERALERAEAARRGRARFRDARSQRERRAFRRWSKAPFRRAGGVSRTSPKPKLTIANWRNRPKRAKPFEGMPPKKTKEPGASKGAL